MEKLWQIEKSGFEVADIERHGSKFLLANGGAWNTVVFGFAGVSFTEDSLNISPCLPEKWEKLSFLLNWKGEKLDIAITKDKVTVNGIKKQRSLFSERTIQYETRFVGTYYHKTRRNTV